jgi:hypothetical protein
MSPHASKIQHLADPDSLRAIDFCPSHRRGKKAHLSFRNSRKADGPVIFSGFVSVHLSAFGFAKNASISLTDLVLSTSSFRSQPLRAILTP